MSSGTTQVAIVGGGMMGIATALELVRRSRVRVSIFEKSGRLGGLSSPFSWNGITWDRFYHVILSTDRGMLDFVRSIGLEEELFWRDTKTGFYDKGKLVSMSSSRDFITFPFLSIWQKIRLGLGILLSASIKDSTKLDRIYVREWLTRLFGRRVYEKVWDPLLRSKLGAAREKTSAAFIWATINRLYGARRGHARVERMGHVQGGYARILESVEHQLKYSGVRLCLDQEVIQVQAIGADPHQRIVVRTSVDDHQFDKVVITLPAPDLLRIIAHNSDRYWESLAKVSYLGVICVLLILKRPLSPYYVVNLLDSSLPFTGIIEATNVVSPDEVGGVHMVYLPRYVVADDPLWKTEDQVIIRTFLRRLQNVFPGFDEQNLLHSAVFREQYVQPLQEVDFLKRSVGFATPISGIYVANTSMIYNSTLNNNAVLRLAAGVASEVLQNSRE
jgi:protoporphyrinogen oxidase